MQGSHYRHKRAFTLIELLVVVAIIALLLSILLPALSRAREQTKNVKCLANLKSLGQGTMLYVADWKDCLPGPLHPAIYREVGTDGAGGDSQYYSDRQLSYLLRKTRAIGDSGGRKLNLTDLIATCPSAATVNPNLNFDIYKQMTGFNPRPLHYSINNWGKNADDTGAVGGQRSTDPVNYFGYSPAPPGTDPAQIAIAKKYPPQPMSRIKKASDEWLVADAWYRMQPHVQTPELQQEGPYQVAWTGDALPNFAPHFAKLSTYVYTTDRNSQSTAIRQGKKDGRTNTAFFDGHAAPVPSKTLIGPGAAAGGWLYGFPGTVNPLKANPPASHPMWGAAWKD